MRMNTLALLAGCFALAVPATAPAFAAQPHNRAGKPTAKAKSNINKPAARQSGPKVSNQQAYKAGQKSGGNKGGNKGRNGNNVVAGNTVVVGQRPGSNGYYDNGNHYHGGGYYDDDDNEFLEFVGKTAAITAGVSVVSAVIGSATTQKPDGCQPVNANGQSYMYCNGTYYQQSGPSSQPTYTVMPPPQ